MICATTSLDSTFQNDILWIRYVIHSGAKDNFVVDYKTGMISVADDVALDIQRSGDVYDIIVSERNSLIHSRFSDVHIFPPRSKPWTKANPSAKLARPRCRSWWRTSTTSGLSLSRYRTRTCPLPSLVCYIVRIAAVLYGIRP